jgi:AMIN domain
MKLMAGLAVTVSMLVAQTERPAIRSVTAVRHWSLKDVTRVAIEVSGDFNFVTERLHNPERVYFDISNSRPRFESRRIFTEQVEDKRLQRIRVAETLPGVTRVVLDLGDAVEATTSQLSNPSRLIIELRTGVGPAIPTAPPIVTPTLEAPSRRPFLVKPAAPKLVRAGASPQIADPPRVGLPKLPKLDPSRFDSMLATKLPSPPPVKIDASRETVTAEPIASELSKTSAPAASPATLSSAAEIGKAARHTATGQTSLVRALGL